MPAAVSSASAPTVLLALASHVVARAVDVVIAAIRLRVWPPIVVNAPPAYSRPLPLSSARALTVLPALGSQLVAVPVDVAIAATRLRVVAPFTVVNAPPAYRTPFPGSIARALTVEFTFGSHDESVSVLTSMAASRLRVVPAMAVKSPPM